MARKTKQTLDDFMLDNELNFDSEFDIDSMISPEVKKRNSRKPINEVFRGTIKGTKDKLRDPSFLGRLTKKALPEQYGEIIDETDKAAASLNALYDEAIRELKPQMASITSRMDRLVPANQKAFKKITTRLSKLFGNDDSKFSAQGDANRKDDAIAAELNSIFGKQEKLRVEEEVRNTARDEITKKIEQKRFVTNFGILNSINERLTGLSNYNEKVNQAYQKKSLELQYRTLFTQQELLSTTKQFYEIFKNQGEAIARNTSLPEFVKISNSERYKEVTKGKFFNKVNESLFGKGGFLGPFVENLQREGKAFLSGFKERLSQADLALSSIEDLQQQRREFAEAGIEMDSGYNMGGQIIGGMAADWVGDKVAAPIRRRLEKNKRVSELGYKGARIARDLPGYMQELSKRRVIQDNAYRQGARGTAARGASWLLDLFRENAPSKRLSNEGSFKDLKSPAVMDNKFYRSVTEIIPGYLSRILRETVVNRTGNNKVGLTSFNFSTGKFMDTSKTKDIIKSTIDDRIKTSSVGGRVDSLYKGLVGDSAVDKKQEEEIKRFLLNTSKIQNMSFTPENVMRTKLFKSLSPASAKIIEDKLSGISKSDTPEKAKYELSKGFSNIKQDIPDFRGEIETFVRAGYGEVLEKEGYITIDKDGNYDINYDKYFGDISNSVVKSDVNAKTGIKNINPKSALSAIKRLKIFNWMYKKGQGDADKHTGPMAQDVYRELGENAAPGGKSIDLTTMNGVNMAAIQGLSDKQDRQSGTGNTILKAIKTDTGMIVKLLARGAGKSTGMGTSIKFDPSKINLGGKESYGAMLNQIGTLGWRLMTKASVDSYQKISTVLDSSAKNVKDKFNKVYDRVFTEKDKDGNTIADRVIQGSKDILNKGITMGRTFLTEMLPNAAKQFMERAKKFGATVAESITGPIDIYVKGRITPALRADLMRLGYYMDSVTGKVIYKVSDLKDIKGDIIDKVGNVVLSIDDIGKGLIDKYGMPLKTIGQKIINAATGLAAKGINATKNFAMSVFGKIKELDLNGIWNNFKESISNFSIGDFGLVGRKTYDVIAEIRDILRTHLGPADSAMASSGGPSLPSGPSPITSGPFAKLNTGSTSSPSSKYVFKGNVGNAFASMRDKLMASQAGQNAKGALSKAGGFIKKVPGVGGILSKVGGLASKIPGAGLIGGILGNFMGGGSSTSEEEPSASPGVKTEETEMPAVFRQEYRKPGASITFNDRDGSGRRDGSWQDRLDAQSAAKANSRKKADMSPADPRYRSNKGIFETLSGMFGGLISNITGGVMGLFGKAMNILGSFGGMGLGKAVGTVLQSIGLGGKLGLGMGKGAFGALKAGGRAIGGLGKLAGRAFGAVGKPLQAGLNLASKIPGISGAVRAAGTVRNVAAIGSLATGGFGSLVSGAVAGGLSALGAALSSPVVLGVAAVAGAGYGIYKLYQYANRNNVDKFEDIRFRQYGVNFNSSIAKLNHVIHTLEAYLLDGKVGYKDNYAWLLGKEIKKEELLEIFDIDPKDNDSVYNFTKWFSERFTPFFLKHCGAVNAANNKVKLNKVSKLTIEEQITYLKQVSYESGPYDVTTSPFKEYSVLSSDKATPIKMIDTLIATLSKQINSKATASDIPKPPQAPKAPMSVSGRDTKDQQKNVNPYAPKKTEPSKNTGPIAEDGAGLKQSSPSTSPSSQMTMGTVGKIAMAGGALKDGEQGLQFLKFMPGVNIDSMNPEMKRQFLGMVQEYGELTGKTVQVNSGSRTSKEQEELWKKDPSKAAPPGRSMHEFGLAIDINSAEANEMDKLGLMKKYGFTRPVGGETWHVEPAGIQTNLGLAKRDPNMASKMVVAGRGKGGAGYGSMPKKPVGGRNDAMAKTLLGMSSKPTVNNAGGSSTITPTAVSNNLSGMSTASTPSGETTSQVIADKAIANASYTSKVANDAIQKASKPTSVTAGVIASKRAALPETEAKPADDSLNVNSEGSSEGGILGLIGRIARKLGVDPKILQTIAATESGLNPNAKASTSSASGLFQMLSGTWNEVMSKFGRKHKIDPSTSPFDPEANAILGGEYIKANMAGLRKVKSDVNAVDVYLAHFFGPSGARKFLSSDPSSIGAEVFPKEAKSNPNIFYKNGRALTIAEIYKNFANKLNVRAKEFGIGTINASLTVKAKNGLPDGEMTAAGSTATSPAPITAPNQPATMPPVSSAPRRPSFNNTDNSILATKPTSAPSGEAMTGEGINSINNTLVKSHGVLLQIHEVLTGILANTNPENLKDVGNGLIKAVETVGAKQQASIGQQAKGYGQDKRYVDLERKVM